MKLIHFHEWYYIMILCSLNIIFKKTNDDQLNEVPPPNAKLLKNELLKRIFPICPTSP